MTSNAFDVHKCSASKIIIIFDAINKHLLDPANLHLNRNKNEMIWKVSEFELEFGIIKVFGCIDGTHILIKTPKIISQNYLNYKQFYSINVQAIYDSRWVVFGHRLPLAWKFLRAWRNPAEYTFGRLKEDWNISVKERIFSKKHH